jgi:hypothetical protein
MKVFHKIAGRIRRSGPYFGAGILAKRGRDAKPAAVQATLEAAAPTVDRFKGPFTYVPTKDSIDGVLRAPPRDENAVGPFMT